MLQYHTFYKKDRLIVIAAYILLEAVLLFHFYTIWHTMRTVDGVGNGWLMMNPLSDFLVLGASVVMAGYFGVCLVAGWRTPRRYVFAMAVWAAVFLLSGSLFPFLFGLSSGENAGIFGQVIPIILWVIIFTVGLKGFLQMLRSSPDGISVEQQSEIPIQKAETYIGKKIYLWFSLASFLAILAEGACRVLYFLANRAVTLNGGTDFFSWASRMGTVMDGVFLDICKVTLACLAVLLFYGKMKLSTYLLGNLLFYGELCIVLPALQWIINPMFVKNVFFSIGLSLIGTAKIMVITLLFYLIACLVQKRRNRIVES